MTDDALEQLIREALEAVEPRNTIASGEADGIIDSIRAAIANARWAAFTDDELDSIYEAIEAWAAQGMLSDHPLYEDLWAALERRRA